MGLNQVTTAIVCDNGEPTFEKCISSLRGQTVPVRIVVAAGPKTDLSLAERIADKVYPPISGIGKARVNAILNEEDEFFLSCDADSLYEAHYAEYALQDLKAGAKAVKAGVILPLEWNNPLVLIETAFSLIPPYEYALAFRKSTFLEAGIHFEDYTGLRADIGGAVVKRLNAWPDFRMVAYTRMPTKGGYEFSEKYLPSAVAGFTPVLAVAGVVGVSEFGKR
jgi:glycosyltransferase involved in cell wall biosynthesis